MDGRGRRLKGKRCEYEVRDFLRSIGYTDAVRVPLSGASEGYKGDIAFTDSDGKKMTVEVKARANGFLTLYKNYVNTISFHPDLGPITVVKASGEWQSLNPVALESMGSKDLKMFHTLYRLKADSSILAVKADRKPILFIYFDRESKWANILDRKADNVQSIIQNQVSCPF